MNDQSVLRSTADHHEMKNLGRIMHAVNVDAVDDQSLKRAGQDLLYM